MKKILLTGASGMIGKRIIGLLSGRGYSLNILGRSIHSHSANIQYFQWDVNAGTLDEKAFDGVEAVIHLAGAGVAEKRWTTSRKKEIIDSRVNSARMIFNFLQSQPHQVKSFISASATGIYGDRGNETLTEESPKANNFLAEVCKEWENAAMQFELLDIRAVCCRIGIVLGKESGALPELTKTFPVGIAGYFSKTPLIYPWIHENDVAGIFVHALLNVKMSGAYNTTAPNPVPIKDLVAAAVKATKSKAVLVPVPKFPLHISLGEMADLLFYSQNCISKKIESAGYKFQFEKVESAVTSIYK